MGAMQELGLKPGVITGDDVLHVVFPLSDYSQLALRICSKAPICYPCDCILFFTCGLTVIECDFVVYSGCVARSCQGL